MFLPSAAMQSDTYVTLYVRCSKCCPTYKMYVEHICVSSEAYLHMYMYVCVHSLQVLWSADIARKGCQELRDESTR